jgi:hypothetical protein
LLLASFTVANAQDFSVDAASQPADPWLPADIVASHGRNVFIPAANIGLLGTDEMDAFSYGYDWFNEPLLHVFFSVDRATLGVAPWAVFTQVVGNGAAGDKFRIVFPGGPGASALWSDAPWHFLQPLPGESNIDGMSDHDAVNVYFSLDPVSAPPYGAPGSPADVFYQATAGAVPGPITIYATEAALGLLPGDDIDALLSNDRWNTPVYGATGVQGVLDAGDIVWVSLAPGSPTLNGPDGIPSTPDDWSAADVIQVYPGPPAVVIPAVNMDLLFEDNLDALATLMGIEGNPVGLTGFNAKEKGGDVVVTWAYPLADADNAGFNLYRGMDREDNFELLNSDRLLVGGNPFEYVDNDVEPGFTYWYKLGVVDLSGGEEISKPVSCFVGPRAVSTYELLGCYPNPTDGSTTISYRMEVAGQVEVSIFDSQGRLVREFVTAEGPGLHEVVWNGRDSRGRTMGPGMYFYKVRIGDWEDSKKVTVVP